MTSAALRIASSALFADREIDWELTILCIVLVALIIAGCTAVVRVRRWRDQEAAPMSLDEHLQSYQALVERGELAPQEFERLKARLQQQLENKAAEPPPPQAPA